MTLTKLQMLDAMHTTAVTRESAEAATLQNALATAAADPNPAFSEAASSAAENLTKTRSLIAGLATLIAEMTPPEGAL